MAGRDRRPGLSPGLIRKVYLPGRTVNHGGDRVPQCGRASLRLRGARAIIRE
jgi:hypothetical protein